MTVDDLCRVVKNYYMKFLTNDRITVITTGPGDGLTSVLDEFNVYIPVKPYHAKLNFKMNTLNDFML